VNTNIVAKDRPLIFYTDILLYCYFLIALIFYRYGNVSGVNTIDSDDMINNK